MFTKYFRNVRLWSVLCVCEREKRVCVSKIIERCVCVCVCVCVLQIQVLEGLLERWLEHENGVAVLGAWLSSQEEKMKRKTRLEDVASVQNTLKDWQETKHHTQQNTQPHTQTHNN